MENSIFMHLYYMKFKNSILLLIVFTVCASFKIDTNNLIGTWVYHGEKAAYAKQRSIPKGRCFIFKKGGKLIVRQNAGWCGTPPITYRNFEGSWELTSDSTIRLSYKNWIDTTTTEWKVSSLTKRWLKMKPIFSKPNE